MSCCGTQQRVGRGGRQDNVHLCSGAQAPCQNQGQKTGLANHIVAPAHPVSCTVKLTHFLKRSNSIMSFQQSASSSSGKHGPSHGNLSALQQFSPKGRSRGGPSSNGQSRARTPSMTAPAKPVMGGLPDASWKASSSGAADQQRLPTWQLTRRWSPWSAFTCWG